MTINRNNYESFFIDYVNNELSATERRQVEAFAATDPDLTGELEQLKEAMLTPDLTIRLDQKAALFKQVAEDGILNMDEVEALIISSWDGELESEEKTLLKELLRQHQVYVQLYDQYAATRLTADQEICFPDKKLLNRTSSKSTPFIYRLARVAVAAVLLVASGVFLWKQPFNPSLSSGEGQSLLSKTPIESKPVAVPAGMAAAVIPNSALKNSGAHKHSTTIIRREAGPAQIEPVMAVNQPESIIEKKGTAIPDETVAMSFSEPVQREHKDAASAAYTPENAAVESLPDTEFPLVLAAADEKENHKIRGFFRKLTRTVERTMNRENIPATEKIRIASFQIALK